MAIMNFGYSWLYDPNTTRINTTALSMDRKLSLPSCGYANAKFYCIGGIGIGVQIPGATLGETRTLSFSNGTGCQNLHTHTHTHAHTQTHVHIYRQIHARSAIERRALIRLQRTHGFGWQPMADRLRHYGTGEISD